MICTSWYSSHTLVSGHWVSKTLSRLFASLSFWTDCMCSIPAWRCFLSWTVEHQRCCWGNVCLFPSPQKNVGLDS